MFWLVVFLAPPVVIVALAVLLATSTRLPWPWSLLCWTLMHVAIAAVLCLYVYTWVPADYSMWRTLRWPPVSSSAAEQHFVFEERLENPAAIAPENRGAIREHIATERTLFALRWIPTSLVASIAIVLTCRRPSRAPGA